MPLTNTEHPTELDNDDLGIDIDMAVENVHNESTSEEKKRVKVIDSNDEEDSIELLTQAIEKSNIAAKDKRRLLEMVEFKGPLPPPSLLLQYDKCIPGLADRIVEMAVNEQNHQHKMDEAKMNAIDTLNSQEVLESQERIKYVEKSMELMKQRQWMFFVIAAGCIGIIAFGVVTGKSFGSMAPVVSALAVLSLTLIFGKYISTKDSENTEKEEE